MSRKWIGLLVVPAFLAQAELTASADCYYAGEAYSTNANLCTLPDHAQKCQADGTWANEGTQPDCPDTRITPKSNSASAAAGLNRGGYCWYGSLAFSTGASLCTLPDHMQKCEASGNWGNESTYAQCPNN